MVRPMKPSEVQRKRNNKTGIRVGNKRSRKKRIFISSRQIFLIAFLLLVFMGSGIGYVWSNFEGTQIGYDLSRLQQEELRLKELNQKLKVELATLKSPQNLERGSRRLGLRQPLPEQIVILP
jgi:cell division protein FtsL